jgi:eukaryotic-like serine/threonine-protein kinase
MLSPGTRLGPYEIVGSLGSGGMGEVYRARDTALHRQVAIKIVPKALADDPDRRARFEREARTLALLNHPHIAAIYGLESAGGLRGIVLELVEGDTLSERIRRGLSMTESLALARQIAEGLEAAHERGIVHRDLKPGNIKVTPDGAVKVLDFGIAKAIGGEPDAAPFDDAPTVTATGTRAGDVLGTPAYMSPEQARGQLVDKRTDLWAFGCVLYEMLTGRSAFGRETPSDTTAAILERDPDWRTLPAATPTTIRILLRRCLEKDRKQRLDSASAARLELADALASDGREPASAPARWRLTALAGAAAGGAVLAGIVTWALLPASGGDRGAPVQYTIVPPPGQIIAVPAFRRSIAISSDGRYVAYYSGSSNLIGPLVVRQLDQLEGRLIPGVPYAGEMTFSPDNRWIGYVDGVSTISKVPVNGGAQIEILRNNTGAGSLAWGDDDAMAFATLDPSTGILRVPDNGGDVEALTRPDAAQGEVDHSAPSVLSRGRGVLFSIVRSGGAQDVAVLDLKTRRSRTLFRGGSPQYVEAVDGSGRRREFVVFSVGNSVRAVPFDGDRLVLTGEPVILADQVYVTGNGKANYSVSQTGTLVYMPATATVARSLVWVDRSGAVASVPDAPSLAYTSPRLSPDGSVVALVAGGNARIATWSFKTARLTQVTTGSGIDNYPIWLPNGHDLLFSSTRAGTAFDIYRQPADGSGAGDRLWTTGNNLIASDVLRDGTQALVAALTSQGPSIYLIPTVAGQGRPTLVLRNAENGKLSPDGRFLAYGSAESGLPEVYVRPFPDTQSARWQISRGGGNSIVWSRDGKELFYLDQADVMMAARTTYSGGTFNVEAPRKLFDASFARAGEYLAYDVAADGRFLMPKPDTGPAGSTSSTLIVKTRVFDVFK